MRCSVGQRLGFLSWKRQTPADRPGSGEVGDKGEDFYLRQPSNERLSASRNRFLREPGRGRRARGAGRGRRERGPWRDSPRLQPEETESTALTLQYGPSD